MSGEPLLLLEVLGLVEALLIFIFLEFGGL